MPDEPPLRRPGLDRTSDYRGVAPRGILRLNRGVARFGGDEFAIIQPGPVESGGGAEVARRIAEALLTPFDVQGAKVTLAASIGIAMAPGQRN